jgi:hypothetical protein
MLHSRWVPSITQGKGNSLDQLVSMGGVDAEIGVTWGGSAELTLGDSNWDELGSILPVKKILGGYYRELGVTFAGGELIHDQSNPAV